MSRSAPTIPNTILYRVSVNTSGHHRISALSDRPACRVFPAGSNLYQGSRLDLPPKADREHDSALEFHIIFYHSDHTELPSAH
jgi:hypothetical protein